MRSLFYKQGDWLALVTSARSRRALCVWLFEIFLILFIIFPNAVWLVNAMSLVAILGIITGETPVEHEILDEENDG